MLSVDDGRGKKEEGRMISTAVLRTVEDTEERLRGKKTRIKEKEGLLDGHGFQRVLE